MAQIQITPAIYNKITDYVLDNSITTWDSSRREIRECNLKDMIFEDGDLVVCVSMGAVEMTYTTGWGSGGYEESLEYCSAHLIVETYDDETNVRVDNDFSNIELKRYLYD